MRVGIDVGGTHTDAVLIDGVSIIGSAKRRTTPEIMEGIIGVLSDLVAETRVPASNVTSVMVGTTHFINAFIQARGLARTAAIRLSLPASSDILPMSTWPERLRQALGDAVFLCHGGHEADGRLISELRTEELLLAAQQINEGSVESVAVTAVFAPIDSSTELAVRDILEPLLPGIPITLSHQVGGLDLLMRENAAIINASLRPLAEKAIVGLSTAIRDCGIDAPVFLTQNDGTVLDAKTVIEFPVTTFASGPTNSMRGASFLTSLDSCIIVDIGGTTSDVGGVHQGYPRERLDGLSLGGVMTNFRMPDVISIGLGGGSVVRCEDGEVFVGPESVGAELTTVARVFGGEVLTATDIAVAAGRARVGDASLVEDLDPALVAAAIDRIDEMVCEVVELSRLSAAPVPVVVVGGGSVLLGEELPGFGRIHRPEHFTVANAIGAANAQISGQIDQIINLVPFQRDALLEQARDEAVEVAVRRGALRSSVEIVEVEQVPLAYLPGHSTRVRVKAVGDLSLETVDVVG